MKVLKAEGAALEFLGAAQCTEKRSDLSRDSFRGERRAGGASICQPSGQGSGFGLDTDLKLSRLPRRRSSAITRCMELGRPGAPDLPSRSNCQRSRISFLATIRRDHNSRRRLINASSKPPRQCSSSR